MITTRHCVGAFIAVTILAAPVFSQGTATDCAASGIVVDAISSEPIARAIVTLGDFNGGTTTDSKGEWSISGQRCGAIHLSATYAGYFTSPNEQQSGKAVVLVSGTPARNLRISLMPESIISGTVQDENGDPMEGATIAIRRVVIANGFRTFGIEGGTVTSDSRGNFREDRLPPGRYVVCAQTSRRTYPVGGGAPLVYSSDCYPGPLSADPSLAAPVEGGRELHVGLTLRSTSGVHVRGNVSGVPSGKIPAVTIGLHSHLGTGSGTNPDANGNFDIASVTPGSYVLSGSLPTSGGYIFGGDPVEVSSSDISGVHLSFGSAGSVAGTVRGVATNSANQARSPTAWVYLKLMSMSGTGDLVSNEQKWNDTHTTFTFPTVLNGSYILSDIDAAREEVFYIKSATLSGQDVWTHPFTVNGATGPIEIVVSDERGGLTLAVTNADGLPAPGTIILKPASGKPILVPTSEDGHAARNVPVGQYRAWAFDDTRNIPYNEDDWMTQHAGPAQTLTISSGGSSNITLKRITAPAEP